MSGELERTIFFTQVICRAHELLYTLGLRALKYDRSVTELGQAVWCFDRQPNTVNVNKRLVRLLHFHPTRNIESMMKEVHEEAALLVRVMLCDSKDDATRFILWGRVECTRIEYWYCTVTT